MEVSILLPIFCRQQISWSNCAVRRNFNKTDRMSHNQISVLLTV